MANDRPLGLILAGGQGRRLGGQDKALVELDGQPLIAHVLGRLRPQVGQIAVSANGDPARLVRWALPVLPDATPGRGPLEGLLAGLVWAQAQPGGAALLCVPVDAPFLPADLAQRLMAAARAAPESPALARTAQGLHPTFALWPAGLAPRLRAYLRGAPKGRLRDFAASCGALAVDFPDEGAFANLNTAEDLAEAQLRCDESPFPSRPDPA